jgi:zinc/manganese transport system ATP-binding protein
VREGIELVGASAYCDRAIGELSGGEQQRLLIAQALVRRPRC